MQNRNATDKLNQQCSKLALFANTINNANLLHCGFSLSVAFLFCILQVTTNLQSSVALEYETSKCNDYKVHVRVYAVLVLANSESGQLH